MTIWLSEKAEHYLLLCCGSLRCFDELRRSPSVALSRRALEPRRRKTDIYCMATFPLRSPTEKVDGLFYFGRMLDKIRLVGQGKLPADYHANLGKGFDEKCVRFLQVNYDELIERVKQGGSDEEILQWCFTVGRKP